MGGMEEQHQLTSYFPHLVPTPGHYMTTASMYNNVGFDIKKSFYEHDVLATYVPEQVSVCFTTTNQLQQEQHQNTTTTKCTDLDQFPLQGGHRGL